MYNTAMPKHDVEPALHHFARQRAKGILHSAPPVLIEGMGGEEHILRMCLRDAIRAKDALTETPRVRLERTVAHWSRLLNNNAANPPKNPNEEDLILLELDGILRTRVAEIQTALSSGDVDGAFTLLRNITVARDGEEQPIAVAVPDTLDPDSAFWLDLDQEN
jgi:hypothetical protein